MGLDLDFEGLSDGKKGRTTTIKKSINRGIISQEEFNELIEKSSEKEIVEKLKTRVTCILYDQIKGVADKKVIENLGNRYIVIK